MQLQIHFFRYWLPITAIIIMGSKLEITEASLSMIEKQIMLDLHNYHRASVNKRQLVHSYSSSLLAGILYLNILLLQVWNSTLAKRAQAMAARCDPESEELLQGVNYYFTDSSLPDGLQQRFSPDLIHPEKFLVSIHQV